MARKNAESRQPFICGVVEGFYGRPWTPDQRKQLFRQIASFGMNSYVYAPKDDLKHRASWRELYTPEETEHLQSLIGEAAAVDVTFIYALSPGLDVGYSSAKDLTALKRKFDQVRDMGCGAFALLFDDIEPTMSDVDKLKFGSFAEAQISMTNAVYEHLRLPKFFFCPTEYCESRCVPSLADSRYLRLVGHKLRPAIHILWTGPRVISRVVSVAHVRRVAAVMRRRPVLWDNLHANDYDQRRVYLGPYSGRPVAICAHLAGVLTNPNCEFEANFVAFYTLSHWCRCDAEAHVDEESDAALEAGGVEPVAVEVTTRARPTILYHPLESLSEAVDAWMRDCCPAPSCSVQSDIPLKPPTGMPFGISTCASLTSTTCSSQAITSVVSVSSAPMSYPAVETRCFDDEAAVSATDAQTKAPFALELAAPSTEEEASDPLLTAAMQAVNSLAPDFCEPMELATASGASQAPTPIDSLAPSPASADSAPVSVDGHAVGGLKVERAAELMDTKSVDELDRAGLADSPQSKRAPDALDGAPQQRMQVDEGFDDLSPLCRQPTLNAKHLQLLVHLFYLPFEHGEMGQYLLDEYRWLASNAAVLGAAENSRLVYDSAEWRRRSNKLLECCDLLTELRVLFMSLPNRSLVYNIYPYLFEIHSVTSVVRAVVEWLARGERLSAPAAAGALNQSDGSVEASQWRDDDDEPWVFRGGLIADMQKEILDRSSAYDLFNLRPLPLPSAQSFVVRLATGADMAALYRLARQMIPELSAVDSADIVGDVLVAPLFELCADFCFVAEDVTGDSLVGAREIVAFAAAAPDAADFTRRSVAHCLPRLRAKYPKAGGSDAAVAGLVAMLHDDSSPLADALRDAYPSVLQLALDSSLRNPQAAKQLLTVLFACLRMKGSVGVFSVLPRCASHMRELYWRLGFEQAPESKSVVDLSAHADVLVRSF